MSKITLTGFVDDCHNDHAWGDPCPGHKVIIEHCLSTDTVSVSDIHNGCVRHLVFNDVIWAKMVELWQDRQKAS